jgi:hypothetical protein
MKYKIDRCHKLNIQIDQAESGLALLIGDKIGNGYLSSILTENSRFRNADIR